MIEDTEIKIGILVASDRVSDGTYEDISGKTIIDVLELYLKSKWEQMYAIVPDEQSVIEKSLIDMADKKKCCLIITTGGTGPSPRDVTPEATKNVCERLLPGFGERMRNISVYSTPNAILSRQIAGIRGSTLIVNLPGKPKAIKESMDAIFPAVPHCIKIINGPHLECDPNVITIASDNKTQGE